MNGSTVKIIASFIKTSFKLAFFYATELFPQLLNHTHPELPEISQQILIQPLSWG